MPPLCITEVLLQEVTGSRFPEALLRWGSSSDSGARDLAGVHTYVSAGPLQTRTHTRLGEEPETAWPQRACRTRGRGPVASVCVIGTVCSPKPGTCLWFYPFPSVFSLFPGNRQRFHLDLRPAVPLLCTCSRPEILLSCRLIFPILGGSSAFPVPWNADEMELHHQAEAQTLTFRSLSLPTLLSRRASQHFSSFYGGFFTSVPTWIVSRISFLYKYVALLLWALRGFYFIIYSLKFPKHWDFPGGPAAETASSGCRGCGFTPRSGH